jgi:hypothetical protein
MSHISLILSGAVLLINGVGLLGAWPAGWFPAGITAVLIAGLFAAALVVSKTGRSQTPAAPGSVAAGVAEPVSA